MSLIPEKPMELETYANMKQMIDETSLVLFNFKSFDWHGYFSVIHNGEVYFGQIFDDRRNLSSPNARKQKRGLEQKISGKVHDGFIIESEGDHLVCLGRQDLYGLKEDNPREIQAFKKWLNIVQSQELYDNIDYAEVFGVDCVVATSYDSNFHYVAVLNDEIIEYLRQDIKQLNLSSENLRSTQRSSGQSIKEFWETQRYLEYALPAFCSGTEESNLDVEIQHLQGNIYEISVTVDNEAKYIFKAPAIQGTISINFGPDEAYDGTEHGTIDHSLKAYEADKEFWNKFTALVQSKYETNLTKDKKRTNIRTTDSLGQTYIHSNILSIPELSIDLKVSLYCPVELGSN